MQMMVSNRLLGIDTFSLYYIFWLLTRNALRTRFLSLFPGAFADQGNEAAATQAADDILALSPGDLV